MLAFNDRFTPRKKFGLTIPVIIVALIATFISVFGFVALGTPGQIPLSILSFIFSFIMILISLYLHKTAHLVRIKGIILTGKNDYMKKTMEIINER